jgi:hypothetical protein
VAKNEKDRATRVLNTLEEAEKYMKEKGLALSGHKIWKRIGVDVRCVDYCPFYLKWCDGEQSKEG